MADLVKKEIRAGIASRLGASVDLQALTGSANRVFYRNPRQAIEYPQVTYHIVDDIPDNAMDLYGKFDMFIQIDVWAKSGAVCDDIQDVVDDLLFDYRMDTTTFSIKHSRREGSTMRFESDAGVEQRSMTWMFRVYKKAA